MSFFLAFFKKCGFTKGKILKCLFCLVLACAIIYAIYPVLLTVYKDGFLIFFMAFVLSGLITKPQRGCNEPGGKRGIEAPKKTTHSM